MQTKQKIPLNLKLNIMLKEKQSGSYDLKVDEPVCICSTRDENVPKICKEKSLIYNMFLNITRVFLKIA